MSNNTSFNAAHVGLYIAFIEMMLPIFNESYCPLYIQIERKLVLKPDRLKYYNFIFYLYQNNKLTGKLEDYLKLTPVVGYLLYKKDKDIRQRLISPKISYCINEEILQHIINYHRENPNLKIN